MTLRHTHCIDTLNKVLLTKTGEKMSIKELHLHGVTSIEAKLTNSNKDVPLWNSRRIQFEMDDGTSFTIVAFANDADLLNFYFKNQKH